MLDGDFGAQARFYHAWRMMLAKARFGRCTVDDLPEVDRAIEAFVELASERNGVESQRMLWSDLSRFYGDAWREDKRERLATAICTEEEIHPWLRAIFAGYHEQDLAWKRRGGKYAKHVTDEQWEGFFKHLSASKTAYLEACDLEPDFPEGFAQMIVIAMADRDSSYDDIVEWFDRARAAQYDYTPAYQNLITASLPRWGGSHRAILRHAADWLAESRFDTDVPFMTVRAMIDLGRDLGDLNAVIRPDGPFEVAVTALRGMADHPAHSDTERRSYTRATLLTQQIALAILSGRDAEAREVLDSLAAEGLDCDRSTMDWNQLPPCLHIPRLYARTGAAAADCRDLGNRNWQQLRGDRDALVHTVNGYRAAKDRANDARANPYFDRWIGVYQREIEFLDGGWVEVPFDVNYSAWYLPIEGLWEIDGVSGISRQENNAAIPRLWCENYFPGAFEIECDIELLETTGSQSIACIRLGSSGAGDPHPLYFGINGTKEFAAVVREDSRMKRRSIEPATRYRVGVQAWPGYYQMRVDGKTVMEGEDSQFDPEGRFALETFPKAANFVAVRYANVRVRRLEPRPMPERAETGSKDEEPTTP